MISYRVIYCILKSCSIIGHTIAGSAKTLRSNRNTGDKSFINSINNRGFICCVQIS